MGMSTSSSIACNSHYLNPVFFYSDSSSEIDQEVVNELYQWIEKLVPSSDVQDITSELKDFLAI